MTRFTTDPALSDTVSTRLQRLARLLQLKSPEAVIQQEIAALQRELGDASMVVTVRATVEVKK